MDEYRAESIDFIKKELLPEAVHNRCFCEPGSREFVELVSTSVESFEGARRNRKTTEYYRARVIVNFSDEPRTFDLIIKLLGRADDNDDFHQAYNMFLNEEMFYSKMSQRYELNIHPQCYVADMGRYGRPVIVLEDLEACGYARVSDGKLDEDHLVPCLRAIAGLHERGLKLKAQNFNSFREFYAKLIDTRSDARFDNNLTEASSRISRILKKLRNEENDNIDLSKEEALVTICHGNLTKEHFFFKCKNDKTIDVRIIGWNRLRYCSIVHDFTYILGDNMFGDEEVEGYLKIYINSFNK